MYLINNAESCTYNFKTKKKCEMLKTHQKFVIFLTISTKLLNFKFIIIKNNLHMSKVSIIIFLKCCENIFYNCSRKKLKKKNFNTFEVILKIKIRKL